MKQLFRQSAKNGTALAALGLSNVTVKTLCPEIDRRYVSQKTHHHTFFELHLIKKGGQRYAIPHGETWVKEGELLLFFPLAPHRPIETEAKTEKLALCFSVSLESELSTALVPPPSGAVLLPVPPLMKTNLLALAAEEEASLPFSSSCSAAHLLCAFVHLFRALGISEANKSKVSETDGRLLAAKAFIRERICLAPTVREVAAHCHLCERQLNRLFQREEGMALSAFIRRERCLRIEELLADPNLSLFKISEQMHFASEYAFNAFFKKHAGMPPGTHRRSMLPK